MLSLAKKKKGARLGSNSPKSDKRSGSDSDWGSSANERKAKKSKAASLSDDSDDDDSQKETVEKMSPPRKQVEKAKPEEESEPEEGQLSTDDDDSDGSSSSDSESSEFHDGFDENLMGDAEDRARLEALTEKERETEIFKRIERRDMMRTRWEIERKLRQAKRSEKAKDGKPRKKKEKKKDKKVHTIPEKVFSPPRPEVSSPVAESPEKKSSESTEYFDPKERSKERKKNVEMNRTDDKRSNAMALLKARREGKIKREEEEAKKEQQRKLEEEKEETIDGVGGKSSVKLKASDIYSDDSGSESDDKASDKRSSTSSKSSSESEDEEQ